MATNSNQMQQMIGIIANEMKEIIKDDLSTMVAQLDSPNQKLIKVALDAYVLALSRIVEFKVAWECIESVFKNNHRDIPSTYYEIFRGNINE